MRILEQAGSPTVADRVYPLCVVGSRPVHLRSAGLFVMGLVGISIYRLTSVAIAPRCRSRFPLHRWVTRLVACLLPAAVYV